jgi:four helix bundle protein
VPKVVKNKEFSIKLEKRTQELAVRIIQLCIKLPNTPEERVIRNQITKSGTSIGANYREASRARSQADFKNNIKICESGTSETQYWIEVILEIKWLSREEVNADCEAIIKLSHLATLAHFKLFLPALCVCV